MLWQVRIEAKAANRVMLGGPTSANNDCSLETVEDSRIIRTKNADQMSTTTETNKSSDDQVGGSPAGKVDPSDQVAPANQPDVVLETSQPAEFATGLPSPYDHPGRDVVIFDGNCRFCFSGVRKLHRWDRRKRLTFVSLHDPFVARHYPDLTHEQMMEQMYVVTRDDHRLGGAAAFRYLTYRIPRLWILAPFMSIPFTLPLWQMAYRQVAKRRYKISQRMGPKCEDGACEVHFK